MIVVRKFVIVAMRGRPYKSHNKQQLEVGSSEFTNSLTTITKDNLVLEKYEGKRWYPDEPNYSIGKHSRQ